MNTYPNITHGHYQSHISHKKNGKKKTKHDHCTLPVLPLPPTPFWSTRDEGAVLFDVGSASNWTELTIKSAGALVAVGGGSMDMRRYRSLEWGGGDPSGGSTVKKQRYIRKRFVANRGGKISWRSFVLAVNVYTCVCAGGLKLPPPPLFASHPSTPRASFFCWQFFPYKIVGRRVWGAYVLILLFYNQWGISLVILVANSCKHC